MTKAKPTPPETDTSDQPTTAVTTAATPGSADQAEATGPEQPSAGGSYVREEDGSLRRVEFTEEASSAGKADAGPADQKTEG